MICIAARLRGDESVYSMEVTIKILLYLKDGGPMSMVRSILVVRSKIPEPDKIFRISISRSARSGSNTQILIDA